MGFKKIYIAAFLLFITMALSTPARAADVRVLMLPFDMHAREDISKIRRDVMEAIAGVVDEKGGEVVGIKRIRDIMHKEGIKRFDEATAFRISEGVKADFAIIGSVSMVGEAMNVDWRVLDLHERSLLRFYFETSESKRELFERVRSKSEKVYDDMMAAISTRPVEMGAVIDRITVIGNIRVDAEAVLRRLSSAEGEPYSSDDVKEDIEQIYALGFFDDVSVDFSETASGRELRFTVKEKPYLKRVRFEGNSEVGEEKIRETITLQENTILDRVLVKENAELIRMLLESEGFNMASVEPQVKISGPDAVVTYKIDEGSEVKIKRVTIIGNEEFSDRKIKKLMKSKQKGLLSFFTGSGKFNEYEFNNDISRVMNFYLDNGYVQADVVKQSVQLSEDKKWFYITISINEGPQYRVNSLDAVGDILKTKEDVLDNVKLKKGDVFDISKLRAGIDAINFMYGDEGFANVEVERKTDINQDDNTIDVTLVITKNNPVYIERIDITGNVKTRDKVIRREIEVVEGELYSSSGVKRSRNSLKRLGYFEDVAINRNPGTSRDKMKLDVSVKERPTGAITLGMGFSSVDKLVATASVSQSNLFGTGKVLEVSGTISATSSKYQLSLTEPWLFDKPLSAGFDIYNTEREYPDFTMEKKGFQLRFGFPLYKRYTKGVITYKYEQADVTDVDKTASLVIRDQEGSSTISSVQFFARHDTRNDAYFPTEGETVTFSVEYAGLGADTIYTKYEGSAIKFFPMPYQTIFAAKAMMGHVATSYGNDVPLYEKYFLGGISSIRGFETRKVGPRDDDTGEYIGGATAAVLNLEVLFPLFGQKSMRGVVFYDIGNAFDSSIDLNDLRSGVGLGVRWFSPVGPIRLEWGYNLDQRDDEDTAQWEFGIGTSF